MWCKAAFWDAYVDRLTDVETVEFPFDDRMTAGFTLCSLYQSDNHSLPSAIWVVWEQHNLSVLNLSGDYLIPEWMLDQIDSVVRELGYDGPVMPFVESSIADHGDYTLKVTRL